MFDNDIFEKWLDSQSELIVDKMGRGEQLRGEEMIVLVLKAQSNHFQHLDRDLRGEMNHLHSETEALRGDFQGEMKALREDFQTEMKDSRASLRTEMKTLREDMDKRFEQLTRRVDRFMFWSMGFTAAAAVFVVNYLK
uniref:DUF1640 domain-containing protein n=1 Tax=Candidatus Kentrum eta TaxID=2126337 RepID=A0A450VJA4_9GAMM|nr:MAG: hypothetical protein BECKH772A_GA0070896_102123 [Candidatus Kentron sp. H]VFK01081.1 MAG: hypothetical protein BECKH772B_GA0070898_102173 [Candidatus Kentron sp. H]VFK04896.1 MAG: hypothetical protein BECKH772C_GA0070978_102183 [Candidatus Kentron sp. H]